MAKKESKVVKEGKTYKIDDKPAEEKTTLEVCG